MGIFLLFALFFIAILLGIPLAFSLGISSLIYLIVEVNTMPWGVIAQRLFEGANSFPLMAIPFFILAGALMNYGGLAKKLVDIAHFLVGFIRGGLAIVNIVGSMFFAGISGSSVADTAAIGSLLIPAMTERGYKKEFSVAVTASSSTIGVIIPPSIPMVLVGVIGGLSIGQLFLAGAIPGILLGFALMLVSYLISKKENYPKEQVPSFRKIVRSVKEGIFALIMPLMILGGIIGGIFTPTEAGAVAALYSFIIGFFVYKKLKLADLPRILYDTLTNTAAIMFLVAVASLFGWILSYERIPQIIANAMLSITENQILILLLINIFLLMIGCVMDMTASLIILTPMFMPLIKTLGIDPIHFGVIMVLNLSIGLFTPPLGVCLIVPCQLAERKISDVLKDILPFFIACVVVLFLITYLPGLVTFLPNLFY
ncbi:MAG: TRAP transporter large permease [Halanaerobiales bacterium]|nr:TRAP transporter large permease [Halanaerobiales bacterium]